MIRDLSIALLACTGVAWAQPEPAPVEHVPDQHLEQFRTNFDALTDHVLGRTSRRVRFDWRKNTVQFGLNGGLPAELNNYDALRAGAFARFPVGGSLLGVELSYVWVWPGESADKIALTPYRQPGRPDRFELDVTFAYPLAEGIVTAVPGWFPATQLVFNAHADFRYLYYPGSFAGLGFTDTARTLLRSSLTTDELANLEGDRLPGMAIDKARYHTLAGLGVDLYFASGVFITQRMLVALPLLAFATDSELLFGLELDLSVGLAF